MELNELPPQNVIYMLLTVGELKKVEGRLKLFKLQHLLQTEAKLKFNNPDEEKGMGYTAYETLDACIQENLIRQSTVQIGFDQPRYDYELSDTGAQLYDIIKPKIPKKDMENFRAVLSKYRDKSGFELMKYTHKKYIDDFEPSKIQELSKTHTRSIAEIQQIMSRLIRTSQVPDVYVMVGKLEHIKKILKVLPNKAQKRVQAGTLLSSVEELEKSLTSAAYRPNDASEELFSFIEYYADKEKIMDAMASIDLATLPLEEQECLSKFLNQLKPQLSF